MTSPQIYRHINLVGPESTLADLLRVEPSATPTGGVSQSSPASYVVISLRGARFIALPMHALIDFIAFEVNQIPDVELAERILRAPLAELFAALTHDAVDAGAMVQESSLEPWTTTVVVQDGVVIGVLPGQVVVTNDLLKDAILSGPFKIYDRKTASKPPKMNGGEQAEKSVHEATDSGSTGTDGAGESGGDLDVPSGNGSDLEPLPTPLPAPPPEPPPVPQGVTREVIRLDTLTPERVTVAQAFDVAVAIRQPTSAVPIVDDLPKLVSTTGTVFRAGEDAVKYRVEVDAKECDVDPESLMFYLERGRDSDIQYFQLTPKREGMLTIIVRAYQADDNVVAANTRIRLQASVLVTDAAKPPDQDAGLRAFKVIQTLFVEDDLREVAFRVGVKWDELSGDRLSTKALDLITFCGTRSLMATLYEAINTVHPEAGLKL
jgi:hypothetical protein